MIWVVLVVGSVQVLPERLPPAIPGSLLSQQVAPYLDDASRREFDCASKSLWVQNPESLWKINLHLAYLKRNLSLMRGDSYFLVYYFLMFHCMPISVFVTTVLTIPDEPKWIISTLV